jgi:hypothetical protein
LIEQLESIGYKRAANLRSGTYCNIFPDKNNTLPSSN